jgi:ABC-type uncharacterized transport system permease subunit
MTAEIETKEAPIMKFSTVAINTASMPLLFAFFIMRERRGFNT